MCVDIYRHNGAHEIYMLTYNVVVCVQRRFGSVGPFSRSYQSLRSPDGEV